MGVLAAVGVALSIMGPTLVGRATDIIFSGAIASALSSDVTKQQAVATLRAAGHTNFAAMLSKMRLVPGARIDFRLLRIILLEIITVYLASGGFLWAQAYLLNDLTQAIMLRFRSDVEEKIHRLPVRYFDGQARGELLSRVSNDLSYISQTLQQSLEQVLTSLPTVLAAAGMMFVISRPLALVALISIPLGIFSAKLIAKHSQRHFVAQWTYTGNINGQIEDAFSGHDVIKAFAHEPEVIRRFEAMNGQLFQASFKAQFISSLLTLSVMFVGNLNYVLIAIFGGLRVATGGLTLGTVQAFIQYSQGFTGGLTQVASIANLVQSSVASAERVFALLDEPEQPIEPTVLALPSVLRGRVEFDRVSFRYEPDKPLIEDLSLTAEAGNTIAIVGPTGAGKTTLVNLLLRFDEIHSGHILLDGVDTAKMPRNWLRSHIGMVLQDAWLFNGTVRDNIRFGRPDATDDEVFEASKAAFVDRFVRSLPNAYETVIDDDSSNLSAGQKQLVTIARAFLTRPTVLILDEATSSIDTRTDIFVQNAIAALRANRTTFIIAHRLSTIRGADFILFMRDGRILEQGTHDGLVARKCSYYEFYHAQFRDKKEWTQTSHYSTSGM